MSQPLASPGHSTLFEHAHVCAFFNTPDEESRVLLPFIKAGIERGQKAFHIVNPDFRDVHLSRLKSAGIDVSSAQQRGQLEVKGWHEAYLRGGRFDQKAMLSLVEEVLNSAPSQGYSSTQFVAHMEWVLEDRPGVNDLLEYEARLNYILPQHKDTVICVYDCAKFGAGVVMNVLRTHPITILGGVLHRNPFYAPPDEFLREVRESGSNVGEDLAAQKNHFTRIIRDLLALAVVPAVWVGPRSERTAEGMADALMTALLLDAVHVCLNRPGEPASEAARFENWPEFGKWLGDTPKTEVQSVVGLPVQRRVDISTAQGRLYVVVTPIGIDAEGGWIAAASQRPEFPGELEGLLLSVMANQAFILFQNARMIAERQRADQVVQALREEIDRTSMFEEIVGSSQALKDVLSTAAKVAPTDSTVLITGETGTGKELIARAIHKRSQRSNRPLVSVSCAALTPSLIASELFGHEKGAFTGAQQRHLGRFELAEGGTIFLDEVGELPAETQIALLRVLQEHEFERVGGSKPIAADVRVIAATNRDLKAAIAAGTFRMDLFYRLNVFPIAVPPLRDRPEDIPILAEYFVQRYASRMGKKIQKIEKTTVDLLRSYSWPGNIRELQNVIERSVILCESDTFTVDERWLSQDPLQPTAGLLDKGVALFERETIEDALRNSKGQVAGPTGAAARLGIPPSTLESKLKALKINKNRFKSA